MPKTKKAAPKKVVKTSGKDSRALAEVKQLYKFMQDNNLGVIDYEEKGVRVKLARQAAAQTDAGCGADLAAADTPSAARQQYAQTIKSPLMGIFFRGSSPSAPPFIKEGESVKAGTPICLIEAMKVFNEVKAAHECVIKKVLVENGQPVKPGDPLFAIEKL